MALKLITAPAAAVVALSDIEAQVRGSLTAETTLINTYIAAVTEKAQTATKRALISQTWELVLDKLPDCNQAIRLPLPPLQSVTSIKYLDDDGVEQTLSSSLYKVDVDSEPGRIVPAYDESWPSTRDEVNAVRVRFVCGYGAAGSNVPDAIKTWILLNVANLYENRETIVVGQKAQMVELSTLCDSLLDSYRMVTF